MLILTRRVNETLMIGDGITITVLGVKGGQVRLGINAPRDVAIHREEVLNRLGSADTGASEPAEDEKTPPPEPDKPV